MGAGVTTSPKPIIDLNGYPDVPQVGDELETNALVVGIFFDPLAIDCLSIKAQAVFFEDIGANFLEDTGEPCNIIRPVSEKIYISCGAMPFLRPEIEKERALQHEGLSVFRAAKPKQNPFHTILRQYKTKVLITPPGKIAKALANRGWYVLAHVSVSR
jgi:hypothetical protein